MGCTSTLYVTNYPSFFSAPDSYQSLAVASVENSYEPKRYVRGLNQSLVSKLYENGFYLVRDYTKTRMSDGELLSELHNSGASDLAVFSTLTSYGESYDSRVETRQESQDIYLVDEDGHYVYDEDGNAIIDHTETYDVEYTVYERTASADLYVEVIDVDSGRSLYSKNRHGSCYEEAEHPDYMSSDADARWCAFNSALDSEVYQICPTYEAISVRDSDVMKIYRVDEMSDEKTRKEEDVFHPGDTMEIVVWFPKAALYNNFSYDIIHGDEDEVITQEDIYWDGYTRRTTYSIDDLRNAAGGMGKFTIRLWNGNRVAFEKKIKVKN